MSRGLGRVQRQILDHLQQVGGSSSFEKLRWELLDHAESGSDSQLSNDKLKASWNTSVLRAVRSLENDEHIQVERRRLATFAECVDHYPSKTLSGKVRKLRLALLPELEQYAREEAADELPRWLDHPRQLSVEEIETYHLKSLDQEALRQLRKAWASLEASLFGLLASASAGDRDAVFMLLAKGKERFCKQGIQAPWSLTQNARELLAREFLPPDIAAQVKRFCDEMMPEERAGYLEYKSVVHRYAFIPRYRRGRLKEETVEYLRIRCPEIVNAGIQGKPARPPRHSMFFPGREEYNKAIDDLFDQTAFQKFQMVKLTAYL